MITNVSNEKSHEELILEKGVLCATLEAGNPFLDDQDLTFSPSKVVSSTSDISCLIPKAEILSENIKEFFNETLQGSLERKNRIPNNPAVIQSVALNYLKLGDIEKAIGAFSEILAANRSYFPALSKLAECYVIRGEIDRAIEIYTENLELGHGNINFLSNLAILFLKKNDIVNAFKYLQTAIKSEHSNPFILNNLGLVSLAQNNPGKAIFYIKKAIKIYNKEYNFYSNLGICFIAIKNLKKALYYFKIAYSLNKFAKNVVHNLSNAFIENGEFESCVTLLGEYIERYPGDLEQRQKIAHCYFEMKLFKRCLKEFNSILKYIDENDKESMASTYNNLAVVYERIGDPARAIEYYKKCFEVYPEAEKSVLYNLLDFFIRYKKIDNTKVILDAALATDPNDPKILCYLGDYYAQKQKYADSKVAYLKAISIDDKALEPYLGLSTLLLEVYEGVDAAIEVLKKGIGYYPKNLAMINNYAYCLILSGNLKKARQVLDNIDVGDYAHITATMGLLYLREGNLEEGRRLYNRAALLAKNNKNLQALVNQKKELELSIYYLGQGRKNEALNRAKKGLRYKTVEKYYHDKLKKIISSLQ